MRNLMPARKNRDLSLWGDWDTEGLFADFFRRPFALSLLSPERIPPIDVYEKDSKVMVKAELPGVKPEEVNLSVDGNLLRIHGEKKQENEVKEKDYYHLEGSYGSFQRTVELPSEVTADKAKATYKDGVLRVELPKAAEEKKEKINIDIK